MPELKAEHQSWQGCDIPQRGHQAEKTWQEFTEISSAGLQTGKYNYIYKYYHNEIGY